MQYIKFYNNLLIYSQVTSNENLITFALSSFKMTACPLVMMVRVVYYKLQIITNYKTSLKNYFVKNIIVKYCMNCNIWEGSAIFP